MAKLQRRAKVKRVGNFTSVERSLLLKGEPNMDDRDIQYYNDNILPFFDDDEYEPIDEDEDKFILER